MAFVSGGIQKSVLQQRQEEADQGLAPTGQQYELHKDETKPQKTITYEMRMKNAQTVIDRQKTTTLLEAANARTQEQREDYEARKAFNIEQTMKKRAQELNDAQILGKEYIEALNRYGATQKKHAYQRDLNTVLKNLGMEKPEFLKKKEEDDERERSGSKKTKRSKSRSHSPSDKKRRRRSRSRSKDRKSSRRRRSRSRSKDRKSSRRRRSRSRSKDRHRSSRSHKSRRSRSRSRSPRKGKSIFKTEEEHKKDISAGAQNYLANKDAMPEAITNRGNSIRIKGADFEQYGDQATKALEAHQKYTDAEGYVTASSGFRYIPRDPNAPIPHSEVKGWLHCWCQTKQFDKPVYELTEEGRPPHKRYTVKLVVKTKTGVELDIKPVVVANSKKIAMQNAAWTFVEELIARGLLQETHAPAKPDGSAGSETQMVGEITGIDVSPEATRAGGGWTLRVFRKNS